MAERSILVTGATGFVGSVLARRLAGAGWRVHATAREGSDRSRLEDLPIRWHAADLRDPPAVRAAFDALRAEGDDAAAVHAAAVISYRTADRELQRRVNVLGTRAVIDAARAAGLRRLVHVSSVVAVGFVDDEAETLTEDAEYNGAELRCDYVDTKRAAEELALAAADGLEVVCVNPGAIYGPGDPRSNTTRFARMIATGRQGPVVPPGGMSVVGIDDVARGIELALERGRSGRRYLLTESNPTMAEVFAAVGEVFGRRPRAVRVPPRPWRLVTAAVALADRVRPGELVTPQSLRLVGRHFRCDSTRARAELGWEPRPFHEVLEATARWMREVGLVGRSDRDARAGGRR